MNRKGFGLIEVMIAAGLMGMIALSIATLIVNLNRSMRAQNQAFEFSQFVQSADALTRMPFTCTPALGGQFFASSPAGTQTPITYVDPSGPLAAGSTVGNLSFTMISLFAIAPIPFTINQYLADLSFAANRSGDIIGPRGMHRSLRIQITTTAGGIITSCSSYSDLTLAKICASVQGTFDPVTQLCSAIP
jgi:type II secretory pathway pseudopilin PulG